MPDGPAVANAGTHLESLRVQYRERDLGGIAAARRTALVEHLRPTDAAEDVLPRELLSGNATIDTALTDLVTSALANGPSPDGDAARLRRRGGGVARAR